MEAHLTRVLMLLAVLCSTAVAGGRYSQNFVVIAPNVEFAQQVCQAAEHYRKTLAVAWLGAELAPWRERCPITVRVGPGLGAGGVTSFRFDQGRPFDWRMSIQGSAERILDSVLPHEVTHTIFATHFGGPLPRWADEGACTTVEHVSEKAKHDQHLYRYLTTDRGIPFNVMFRLAEYPQDIMPLYAQGHSVVEYLVAHGGRRRFVDFLAAGMQSHDWDRSIREWYGFADLSDLQIRWVDWLRHGRPPLQPDVQLAAHTPGPGTPASMPRESVAAPPANSLAAQGQPEGGILSMAAARTTPSTTMIAQGSWYARQHDETQNLLTTSSRPGAAFTPGSTVAIHGDIHSTGRAPDDGQSATAVVDWGHEGHWTSPKYRR